MTVPSQERDRAQNDQDVADARKQWVSPKLKTYPVATVTHSGAVGGPVENILYTNS